MKAEDAKAPGAGIIPKLCPRKCVVEMEHGSNRPIGVRGRPELRAAAYGTIGREVALEGKMAVERDRRLIRAFLAESGPQGGPSMSQLGSAGQCARVRPGRVLYCAENSEKEEPCRCQGPVYQMAE